LKFNVLKKRPRNACHFWRAVIYSLLGGWPSLREKLMLPPCKAKDGNSALIRASIDANFDA